MSNGHFFLTATNFEYPGPGPYCGEWFEYEGDLEVGGCNVGEGWWNNPAVWDQFWWDKTCEVPSGETTHQTLEGWLYPHFFFRADIPDTWGGNLSGRAVRETDFAAGGDSCWYPESSVPYWDGVTPGDPANLSADNRYLDQVGWGSFAINHYGVQE
jgi:hypothetical protein